MSAVIEDAPVSRSRPLVSITTYDDPLFGSVHQALLFAYTFTDNQHAVAAAAERAIALFAKGRYAKESLEVARTVRSRGLIGLYGAAQAGFIKAAVERLPAAQQRVIESRFDVLHPEHQARAMRELVLHARRSTIRAESEVPLLCVFVQRHFGAEVSMDDLVERWAHVMCRRTLYQRSMAAKKHLRQLEDRAMAWLENELGPNVCAACA